MLRCSMEREIEQHKEAACAGVSKIWPELLTTLQVPTRPSIIEVRTHVLPMPRLIRENLVEAWGSRWVEILVKH